VLVDSPASRVQAPPLQIEEAFRAAMRQLAASVTIITSRDTDGTPHGMAASSVISVSMDPASMLIAVNRSAGLHPVLLRSRKFCINLLSESQGELLKPFSNSSLRDQRFQSPNWRDALPSESVRLPWLTDAAASMECEVDLVTDYGTHSLFVGRVLLVHGGPQVQSASSAAAPLVWLAGRQATLSRP
jgi:flavin reductase (DIM6/NTAB) family NADH-FMN oxidoreductase RutF